MTEWVDYFKSGFDNEIQSVNNQIYLSNKDQNPDKNIDQYQLSNSKETNLENTRNDLKLNENHFAYDNPKTKNNSETNFDKFYISDNFLYKNYKPKNTIYNKKLKVDKNVNKDLKNTFSQFSKIFINKSEAKRTHKKQKDKDLFIQTDRYKMSNQILIEKLLNSFPEENVYCNVERRKTQLKDLTCFLNKIEQISHKEFYLPPTQKQSKEKFYENLISSLHKNKLKVKS